MVSTADLLAQLYGQQIQPKIEAINPYNPFVSATSSINNAVMQGAGSGKFSTTDLLTSALISGLMSGGASGLSQNYASQQQQGYQQALSDMMNGNAVTQNTYGLEPSIFSDATQRASLFKLQQQAEAADRVQKQQDAITGQVYGALAPEIAKNPRNAPAILAAGQNTINSLFKAPVTAAAPVVAPTSTEIAPVVLPNATAPTETSIAAPVAVVGTNEPTTPEQYDALHIENTPEKNLENWEKIQKSKSDLLEKDLDNVRQLESVQAVQTLRQLQPIAETLPDLVTTDDIVSGQNLLAALAKSRDPTGSVTDASITAAVKSVPGLSGIVGNLSSYINGDNPIPIGARIEIAKAIDAKIQGITKAANDVVTRQNAPYLARKLEPKFEYFQLPSFEKEFTARIQKQNPGATPEQVQNIITSKQGAQGDNAPSLFAPQAVVGPIQAESLSNNGAMSGVQNTFGNVIRGVRDLPGNIVGFVGDTLDSAATVAGGDKFARDPQGNLIWGEDRFGLGIPVPAVQDASRLAAAEHLATNIGQGAAGTAGYIASGANPLGGAAGMRVFDAVKSAALGEPIAPLSARQEVGNLFYNAGGFKGGKLLDSAVAKTGEKIQNVKTLTTEAGTDAAAAETLRVLAQDASLSVPTADARSIAPQTLAERTGSKPLADAQAVAKRTGGGGVLFTEVEKAQKAARDAYFDKEVTPTTINDISDKTAGDLISTHLEAEKTMMQEQASVGYTPELIKKTVPLGPAKTMTGTALDNFGITREKLMSGDYPTDFKNLYEKVTDPKAKTMSLGEIIDLRRQASEVASDLYNTPGRGRLAKVAVQIKDGLTAAIEKAPENPKSDLSAKQAKDWKKANDLYAEYMKTYEEGIIGEITQKQKGEFTVNRSDIWRKVMDSPENIKRFVEVAPLNAVDALREYVIAEYRAKTPTQQRGYVKTKRAELVELFNGPESKSAPQQLKAIQDVLASEDISKATTDLGDAESKARSITAQEQARTPLIKNAIGDVLGIEKPTTARGELKGAVRNAAGGLFGAALGSLFAGTVSGGLGGGIGGLLLADKVGNIAAKVKPALVEPGMSAIRTKVIRGLADADYAAQLLQSQRMSAPQSLPNQGAELGLLAAANAERRQAAAVPSNQILIESALGALKAQPQQLPDQKVAIVPQRPAAPAEALNPAEFQMLEQQPDTGPSLTTPEGNQVPASFDGVPIDKVLNVVEKIEWNGKGSGVSPVGAKGPYQFMDETAKSYGLSDPFNKAEARIAAAKLLTDEYNALGNLPLALAAYNYGRPRTLKAIKAAGSSEWRDVARHLPKETREYIDKFNKKILTAT